MWRAGFAAIIMARRESARARMSETCAGTPEGVGRKKCGLAGKRCARTRVEAIDSYQDGSGWVRLVVGLDGWS
jgi:hypothetical protein